MMAERDIEFELDISDLDEVDDQELERRLTALAGETYLWRKVLWKIHGRYEQGHRRVRIVGRGPRPGDGIGAGWHWEAEPIQASGGNYAGASG